MSTVSRASLLASLATALLLPSAAGQDPFDVTWTSPSADARGSMPLGNGEVALNAWVEDDGDLRFYLARTDSWSEHGRLLKVGRVRVHLEPSPLAPGTAFRQTLRLADATVEVRFGEGDRATVLELWVDVHHPVVHVSVRSPEDVTATAILEPWRTEPLTLPSIEVSDVYLDRSRPGDQHAPTVVQPDVLVRDTPERIGWYHHNRESVGPELTARIQGTDGLPREDPLRGRTFGGLVAGDGGRRLDERRLECGPSRRHHLRVVVHTAHPSDPAAWQAEAESILEASDRIPRDRQRRRHEDHWQEFWGRSWIHVTGTGADSGPRLLPPDRHPVRIGADQSGANRFAGTLGRVSILDRALDPEEVAELAGRPADAPLAPGPGVRHRAVGPVPEGIPGSATWGLGPALTLEAWVRPGGAPAGGRIVDRITPGGSDGFLLDTHPGLGLRVIVGGHTLAIPDVLTTGTWAHVAAVVDPDAGALRLYLDGRLRAVREVEGGDDAFVVSRAYALQRFLDACAGNGRYPIKFNGSLFTVPHPGTPGDADYRRWGPGYWWQNTRLPYLSLCASGDAEGMRPLFRMYAEDLLPLFVHRTRLYFGHGGAFVPECIYFWGEVFSETYGWTPFEERGEDKLQSSGWHKWEWVSGLELTAMMLDYWEHTQDPVFLQDTLLPAAREFLAFFDQHYPVNEVGVLVMHPAQALETWWDCTDPMPEVAGLHAVTARLLALPEEATSAADRASWARLRQRLPPLPTREVEGRLALAPAARFADKRNIENPELYAVFPFRLVSFEKDNAELGRVALEHRLDRGHSGWRQDDLFFATLGLADQARAHLVARARAVHEGSRFPAFWGPNYDWVPDQDHGGVLMRALQLMLMQTEGRAIHLLPAWPADWDVSFRLHAPYRTTVQGVVRQGELHDLVVLPEERARDVIVHPVAGSR